MSKMRCSLEQRNEICTNARQQTFSTNSTPPSSFNHISLIPSQRNSTVHRFINTLYLFQHRSSHSIMPNQTKRDPALLCNFIKPDRKHCQNFKTKAGNGSRLEICNFPSHQPGYVKPESVLKSASVKRNRLENAADGMNPTVDFYDDYNDDDRSWSHG